MHRHDASQGRFVAPYLARLAIGTVALLLMLRAPAFASARSWEPLIIKCVKVSSLIGGKISHLEVLAVHGGKLEPIPFQVDLRTPDGRFVLPNGPKGSNENRGTLTPYDEVSMMISDLGPRLEASAVSKLPLGALEIDVHDPLGGPDRYCYIATVNHPRRTSKRYIVYDPKTYRIETDRYRLSFTNDFPSYYSQQTRMYEDGPNMIDKFKVRVSARILKIFPFHMTENDVHNHLLAWKAGPIRIIRRLSHSVRLILGIHSPRVTSVDLFYRNFGENPFKVNFPWVPRLIFGDIHVRLFIAFRNLKGYKLTWSGMKGPPVVIGEPETEQRLVDHPPTVKWIAITGGGRVMVQTFAPTPTLRHLDFRLYYRDKAQSSADGSESGAHPDIGYQIRGWDSLSSGEHHVVPILLTANAGYNPETLLRELHTPPAVTVRRVRRVGTGPNGVEANPSAASSGESQIGQTARAGAR